jgi:hypothetical protein
MELYRLLASLAQLGALQHKLFSNKPSTAAVLTLAPPDSTVLTLHPTLAEHFGGCGNQCQGLKGVSQQFLTDCGRRDESDHQEQPSSQDLLTDPWIRQQKLVPRK